ncbi:TrbC/VirB2 family protein [Agrobacterium burrii]
MSFIRLHLQRNIKIYRLLFAATTYMLLSAHPSAAQEFSGITNFIDGIVKALTGPLGIACASIAVIAIGFVFMLGRMDWTFAISVILGIAIVFGGATFVGSLSAN